MTIYRSQKGNKWHLIIEKARNPMNPYLNCHTCATSVHELSDNDNDCTNSQMQCTF